MTELNSFWSNMQTWSKRHTRYLYPPDRAETRCVTFTLKSRRIAPPMWWTRVAKWDWNNAKPNTSNINSILCWFADRNETIVSWKKIELQTIRAKIRYKSRKVSSLMWQISNRFLNCRRNRQYCKLYNWKRNISKITNSCFLVNPLKQTITPSIIVQ